MHGKLFEKMEPAKPVLRTLALKAPIVVDQTSVDRASTSSNLGTARPAQPTPELLQVAETVSQSHVATMKSAGAMAPVRHVLHIPH